MDAADGGLGVLVALVRECEPSVPLLSGVRTSWALVHGYASLRIGGLGSFQGTTPECIRDDLAVLLDGLLARG